mmetsp:Transcript_10918/g.16295  ORF Transcript_10918/g.16295 Transcript_10918/m.16295 type:complete len:462 (-) Transcript_10918:172-1557(-)
MSVRSQWRLARGIGRFTGGKYAKRQRKYVDTKLKNKRTPVSEAAEPNGLSRQSRCLVVGAGITGLACTAFLRRIGLAVDLYEVQSKAQYISKGRNGFGLWSNALSLLDKLDIVENLEKKGRYMAKAGYRDIMGRWLAHSSHSLGQSIREKPSSLFILESDLLEQLRSITGEPTFEKEVSHIEEIESEKYMIHCAKNSKNSLTSGNNSVYDLVIMALGSREAIGTDEKDMVNYRGYSVYRGLTKKGALSLQAETNTPDSFQTWAKGRRFATVPLRDSWVWYCTIPSRVKLYPGETSKISEDHFEELKQSFSAWHDPIPQLLAATNVKSVTVESAMAHSDIPRAVSGRIIYLGDVGCTLDPILAQGGGVAIEQAAALTSSLSNVINGKEDFESAIGDFERDREKRLKVLQQLSDFSQDIGCLEGPWDAVRNSLMCSIPSNIKCRVFDHFMAASLSKSLWNLNE